MIENIDHNVGRLLLHLHGDDLMNNTVVIFMSDNGMTGGGSGRAGQSLGSTPAGNRMPFFNAGMKGLKGSPDEGGIRVPFLVRGDGRWPGGRDVDRIAGDIDIFPTLAELAGAENPAGQVEGRSLLPLLRNPAAEWPDRYLFTHVGRWPTAANPDDFKLKNFSIRSQQFRFVNNEFLFDMQADPGQQTNVIDQHPDVVLKMRKAWDDWWEQTRPLLVNESAPMSKIRPFHQLYFQQLQNGGIPEWSPEWTGGRQ
jgi:arylsulfatase